MKRCISCNLAAEFAVKGSNEYYCRECAEMELGNLSMIIPIDNKSNKN